LDEELSLFIPRLPLRRCGTPNGHTTGRPFLAAGEEFPTFAFKATILICLTVKR
jgi:hypothetical protein